MFDKLEFRHSECSQKVLEAFIDTRTGEIRTFGKIGPFRVISSGSGFRGSVNVPLAIHGTKLKGVSRTEYINALPKWSELLGVDIDTAIVRNLEIGVNIILSNPVKQYPKHFGELPRFDRFQHKDGLCWKQREEEFAMYNKLREVSNKRGNIPEGFKEKNVARVELRLKRKALDRLFGCITVGELAEVTVWRKASNYFLERYEGIKVVPCIQLPTCDITPSSLHKILEACGAQNERLMNSLKDAIDVEPDRVKRSRLRAVISAAQAGNLTELPHSPLRDEFDSKVRVELKYLTENYHRIQHGENTDGKRSRSNNRESEANR